MAIPLIQNVEKQDINTSIIAIRRQLEQLYNALGVTENTVSSEDISKSTGTPLGTWASFVNDYAPNGEWLESGSTFNENTYPALAMMLGGNVVPIMYDHSRPSDYETITIPLSSASAITMQYDGILHINLDTSANKTVYVNGVEVTAYTSTNMGITYTVTVKKGDTVYATGHIQTPCYARWFKHPLFIKATPTSADSDYEGTLNAIREFYVRNNTYSTEERLTGGVWIDGKPIYRKVIDLTNVANGTVLLSNVKMVINSGGMQKDSSTSNQYQAFPHPYASYNQQWRLNTSNQVVALFTRTDTGGYCWFEYTKTTD